MAALSHVQQEFIPFFLNYLRDHTLHLLQNSKSANPSPAKTPSLKKLHKPARKEKGEGSKRQQLFGSSPAGDVDDIKYLPTSVFTPNTSIDSPGYNSYSKNDRQSQRGGSKSNYVSQKFSPRCGSQNSSFNQQTPDHQRSKQKISLGEFLYTPDQGSHGYKKRSPHSGPSGGRRDYFSETSPTPGMPRRSGGRKKPNTSPSPLLQTSPFVRTGSSRQEVETQLPPVFCLASNSDFPPMDSDKRSFDRVFSNTCDTKASRVINFSCPENDQDRSDTKSNEHGNLDSHDSISKRTDVKLKSNYRKLSPAIQNQTSTPKPKQINPRYSQANKSGPRRITPTFIKGDNSVPQNSAFLVPVEESPTETFNVATQDRDQTKDQIISL